MSIAIVVVGLVVVAVVAVVLLKKKSTAAVSTPVAATPAPEPKDPNKIRDGNPDLKPGEKLP